ncbi:Alpha/beta hydrolase family protein [Aliiroseovarius halocynthiae]|uniref:Alpha/beta fold hydrolase n=1 Tax=Aliiroseovarius halocynthiae TaxID=985055 RepID=A0A545SV71_9RHOB|nr:alpha/beta fold hydrolase [Aliiroseovarius halocynthiae]TQV68861.1 alpha/beta fold hydrolase [Aliiroseovarius halocynthiae]SMR71294.1 Alpha/beta hydrolase family protein [Aliiroseovarius halocynthiae]
MNNLINKARHLPMRAPVQTISIDPVTLDAQFRSQPLVMRITAPIDGKDLPIVLLSHGDGPSLYLPSKDGYGPLATFLAGQGFAVIQPTHANSKVGGLPHTQLGAPLFWRMRVNEMKHIIDQLDEIESAVPLLAGRLDHDRIAAIGHSMGGQTVGMLLGARLTDPKNATDTDVSVIDPRIKAGVLLAPPGRGGDNLSDFARENFSELNPDYSHLSTPSLVVVGNEDVNPFMTVRGAEWYRAAYEDGPGVSHLLNLVQGQHGLGGIAGYDAKETGDEDPDRLAVVQRATSAFLYSHLYSNDPSWAQTLEALQSHCGAVATVETK